MTIKPVGVGIMGCGNISGIYLQNLTQAPEVQVLAVADVDQSRAQAQAATYNVPRACSPEELLSDPAVELVINLTVPLAHGDVGLAALRAGKSIYNEKPLAFSREQARAQLDEAAARGLLVGGAPDTFLGGGIQTCRRLIDDGAIGKPVNVNMLMLSSGPEGWHPNPAFFYAPGGGPLFDMAPYYLTCTTALVGPAERVQATTRITHQTRTAGHESRRGEIIPVTTPTSITALIELAGGAVATLVTSFDMSEGYAPHVMIYGTEGALHVPDPNTFGGPVLLRRRGQKEWEEMPVTGPVVNSRGIGVIDLARALRSGAAPRASGAMAFHVVDTMHAIMEAAETQRAVTVTSGVERPAAM